MASVLPTFLREVTPILKKSDINLLGKISSITSNVAPTEILANGNNIGKRYKLDKDCFYSIVMDSKTGIKTEKLKDKDLRYVIQTIDDTEKGPIQRILAIFKNKTIDEEIYENGKLASKIEHFYNADLPYRVTNFNPESSLPTKYIQYGRAPFFGVQPVKEKSFRILPDNSVEVTETFQVNGRHGGYYVDTYEPGFNAANPFDTGHKINQKEYSSNRVLFSDDKITRTSDTVENVIRTKYSYDGSGRVIGTDAFTRHVQELPKGMTIEREYSRYI